jgi:hypothetical protein
MGVKLCVNSPDHMTLAIQSLGDAYRVDESSNKSSVASEAITMGEPLGMEIQGMTIQGF